MAAGMDFRSTVLPISYVHRYSPCDATVAGLGVALSQKAFEQTLKTDLFSVNRDSFMIVRLDRNN